MSRMREGGPNESLISAVWRLVIRVNRICLSLWILADISLYQCGRGSDYIRAYGQIQSCTVPLGLEAAGQALQDADVTSSELTHLITVSCTGQFLPGLDVRLIQQLELSPQSTGFRWCFRDVQPVEGDSTGEFHCNGRSEGYSSYRVCGTMYTSLSAICQTGRPVCCIFLRRRCALPVLLVVRNRTAMNVFD